MVAKLSPTGQILYSTIFSGNRFNDAYAIAVDSTGAAYIFGETSSTDFPVTPGALQTTLQAQHMQGFAAKLDPNGKVVYATFIGGSSDIGPQSILVDSAGDAILSGGTSTSGAPGAGAFPVTSGAPYTSIDAGTSFVMKLDPLGQKQLAAIRGIGGSITMDSKGNIYVVGQQYGVANTPIPVTPGAFQTEPANVCSELGNFFECSYQYVAKLNPGLTQIVYSTYIAGEYGESPAAIAVDAQGDAFVAGTTYSPDYPTTPNAYEPQYIASAVPSLNCFFIINCVNLPPASGYVTELNPTGTGLIYSSFFSGTQTDTITFAAFTPSANLSRRQCEPQPTSPDSPATTSSVLPQTYATRLSADGTETGASRVTPGSVFGYDAFAGTLIATSGIERCRFQPQRPADSHRLHRRFGRFAAGNFHCTRRTVVPVWRVRIRRPGDLPAARTVPDFCSTAPAADLNGIPSPLLYVGGEQINFQALFETAGAASASIVLTAPQRGVSDSITLPIVAINPGAFLNTPPDATITPCIYESSASVNGTFPLTLNPDGSINACLNPAPAGSIVTLFLDGLGVTSPAQVTGAISPNPSPTLSLSGHHGEWGANGRLRLGAAGLHFRRLASGLARYPRMHPREGTRCRSRQAAYRCGIPV